MKKSACLPVWLVVCGVVSRRLVRRYAGRVEAYEAELAGLVASGGGEL